MRWRTESAHPWDHHRTMLFRIFRNIRLSLYGRRRDASSSDFFLGTWRSTPNEATLSVELTNHMGFHVNTSLPSPGVCPRCGGLFEIVARTGIYARIGTPLSEDMLEWRCAHRGHRDDEIRRQGDGVDVDWPASQFAAPAQ